MISKRVLPALLLIGAGFSPSAQEGTRAAASKRRVFGADDTFLSYHSENLEKITLGNRQVWRLLRKADAKATPDDLVIDFESEALFSNPAHQPLIVKARVDRSEHTGFNGKAGGFNLPEHKLKIKLPAFLHLSGEGLTRDAGDFTFALEFEPQTAQAELLRRENFVAGRQYLFAVTLRNNRIIVTFENLFAEAHSERGKYLESTELKSVDKVKPGKRNALALTYHEATGKLRLILNDREQATYSLKRTAEENYTVSFAELRSSPFTLFQGFLGYADNIVFSNRVLTDEDMRHFGALTPYGDRYDQRKGILRSNVYDMGFSQSSITALSASLSESEENRIAVSFRCLDKRFDARLADSALRFRAINGAAGKKCRFVQFQAEFTADNAGKTSPHLKGITLEYRENPPPDKPAKPRLIAAQSDSLELELISNTELDVVQGGRYIVYYGHKAHEAEGAFYVRADRKPIAHKVPIRLALGLDAIMVNKAWADKNPRFRHRYPIFEPGIGYYFWVTACDNAYGEAQELADHESAPSEAIFVRFRSASE